MSDCIKLSGVKQYSRIVADSIRDWRVLSEIRGYFHGQRLTITQQPEQTGTVGRAYFGVPQQRPERQDLVQGERRLRADLLQMAAAVI